MTQSATHLLTPEEANANPPLEAMVVRFAGDSGDGMQLTGGQFTLSTALAGNDLATFPTSRPNPRAARHAVRRLRVPDQLRLTAIDTAGDAPDVLVAMNPAALKTNAQALKPGGLIIADDRRVHQAQPRQGRIRRNPLDDGSLAKWQLLRFNISR